jgi:integrase
VSVRLLLVALLQYVVACASLSLLQFERLKRMRLRPAALERRGVDGYAEAIAWAEERERVLAGAYDDKTIHSVNMTVGEAIDRYIKEFLPLTRISAAECKMLKEKRERDFQKSRLGYLTQWKELLGGERLGSLTKERLNCVRSGMRVYKVNKDGEEKEVTRSNSTLNGAMSHLSVVLGKCVDEWSWLRENPCARVKSLKEPRGRTRFLDPKTELSMLLKAGEEENLRPWRCFVIIGVFPGMRYEEIRTLEWRNVSMEKREIILRAEQTKTDMPRVIPLRDEAIAAIEEMRGTSHPEDEYVFQSRHPERRKQEAFMNARKGIRRLFKAAVLKDFRGHDMRHTFASYLAQSGESLLSIAALCGHSTTETTKRYAHLTKQHLHKSIRSMDRIFEDSLGDGEAES